MTKKPARARRMPKAKRPPKRSAARPPAARGVIPRHQWTHDGAEVLVLKWVGTNGETYEGFQWPLTVGATVEQTTWNEQLVCGGGLHGWPWGFSIGDGKDPDWHAIWLVFGALPTDVVGGGGDLVGKCKARRGTIRYIGDWQGATNYVLAGQMAWVHHAASGAASATGASGAAMVTGTSGRARGGLYGCIALAWWNTTAARSEMRCAEIGCGDGSDGKLKAAVWYQLDADGRFVEALAVIGAKVAL